MGISELISTMADGILILLRNYNFFFQQVFLLYTYYYYIFFKALLFIVRLVPHVKWLSDYIYIYPLLNKTSRNFRKKI